MYSKEKKKCLVVHRSPSSRWGSITWVFWRQIKGWPYFWRGGYRLPQTWDQRGTTHSPVFLKSPPSHHWISWISTLELHMEWGYCLGEHVMKKPHGVASMTHDSITSPHRAGLQGVRPPTGQSRGKGTQKRGQHGNYWAYGGAKSMVASKAGKGRGEYRSGDGGKRERRVYPFWFLSIKEGPMLRTGDRHPVGGIGSTHPRASGSYYLQLCSPWTWTF